MFADPVEESDEDPVSINTLCDPQKPELDLKWKYCGFYSPLKK